MDFWRPVPKKRQVKLKGKSGLIYRSLTVWGKYLFYFGNLLVVTAVIYLVYLYYPLAAAGVKIKFSQQNQKSEKQETLKKATEAKIDLNDFWVKIPKLGIESKVKANVSAYNKQEYLPVLADNIVAHARGSGLPGEGKTVYLFAHSTMQTISMVRKNAVFYWLGRLEAGDLIQVGFSGQDYTYQVKEKVIANKRQADYLDYQAKDKETLILQTCWPVGTNFKRLLVLADRI